jgi:dolichol-phosphate mannosyltransferase
VIPGVSIVIPAWNEEGRLRDTLETYVSVLERTRAPFEIIVVTDGCGDATDEIARSFGSRRVALLSFPHRLGKGGAILAGMKESRYDRVGFVDADGPVEATDLLNLASSLSTCDCAVASRWARGSMVLRPQPVPRVVLGRLWNMLVRFALLLPVKDTQCGAKFLRRAVFDDVGQRITVSDWAFDAALLFNIRVAGYSIREIPVTWTNKDGSKMILTNAIPRMILSLFEIRLGNTGPGGVSSNRLLAWLRDRRFRKDFSSQ